MDTPEECKKIDFDNEYFGLFGCYPEDEEEPETEEEEEEYSERVRMVRRSLGWDRW